MFGWFKKKKNEKPDRPKVYATARGGLYVKIEELEASKVWEDLMDEMQREIQRRPETGESRVNESDVAEIKAALQVLNKKFEKLIREYSRTRPAEVLSEVKRTAGAND